MNLRFSNLIKRNISLIIILFLAALCCGSFDVSYDTFGSGGSLRGSSHAAISRSLIALAPSAIREDEGGNSGHDQSFGKTNTASDILSRIVRKLLQILGGYSPAGSAAHFRRCFLLLCTASFAYLFLLTNVRFIHLKDGSK